MQMSDFYPEERVRGLPLPFSKQHRGKLIEHLIINEPVFIRWLLCKGIYPQFHAAEEHIRWCIKRFDEKPFVTRCQTKGCKHVATRCTLYPGSPFPRFWCYDCNPEGDALVLMPATTYQDVLHFLDIWCGNNRKLCRVLLRKLATAKGLPATLTTKAVVDWFHG